MNYTFHDLLYGSFFDKEHTSTFTFAISLVHDHFHI